MAAAPSGSPGGGDKVVPAKVAVVVYGASWCGACQKTRAYLKQKNVPFVDKDIDVLDRTQVLFAVGSRWQPVPARSSAESTARTAASSDRAERKAMGASGIAMVRLADIITLLSP